LRQRLRDIKEAPLLSVVMPVYDPPVEFLNRAIASVCSQVYENWELCIADDASTQGWVRDALAKWSQIDKRIKVHYRDVNGNISVASNTAISLAQGTHLVFLDQDDILTPDALGEIAIYIAGRPDTDILYSDDDKIGATENVLPRNLSLTGRRSYCFLYVFQPHLCDQQEPV
jgi:glycosyltransferase involved in cell wall biosynthesis